MGSEVSSSLTMYLFPVSPGHCGKDFTAHVGRPHRCAVIEAPIHGVQHQCNAGHEQDPERKLFTQCIVSMPTDCAGSNVESHPAHTIREYCPDRIPVRLSL